MAVATEVADALAAAHGEGVIHRDLKPGNVMMTKAGDKLLDFGLAKLQMEPVGARSTTISAPAQLEPVTTDGALPGTLPYMAPEQLEGRGADARSDIFAFGAVLYEMITGERAFPGGTQAAVAAAILGRDPPSPRVVRLDIPLALDRFCRPVSRQGTIGPLAVGARHRPVPANHSGAARGAGNRALEVRAGHGRHAGAGGRRGWSCGAGVLARHCRYNNPAIDSTVGHAAGRYDARAQRWTPKGGRASQARPMDDR